MNGNLEESNPEESILLRGILKEVSTLEFFERIWQLRAHVFRYSPALTKDSPVEGGDGTWNEDLMQHDLLKEIVEQRWNILRDLFERSEQVQASSQRFQQGPPTVHELPLVFRNRELQHRDEVEEMYGNSLFAPYLNGCSVVLNHGDLLSPWIAALCQDLQQTFPHAYANCYLTPPNSQAVPAHADDRDVFVIQLVGSKDWQVYEHVPIPYPYPHQQVGKEGLAVPKEVLEGPVTISTTLRPGDILYMPRGFVHQASCSSNLSFHITVALATHDWTLAGMMSMATETILTRTVEYRKSLLPTLSINNDMARLQEQIDTAVQMIQSEITAENLLRNLKGRLEQHNHRAFPLRMKLIHEARFPSTKQQQQPQDPGRLVQSTQTGLLASQSLTFTSRVRASTMEERSQVAMTSTQKRGLHVREEIADSIMSIVSQLKADPSLTCKVIELRTLLSVENPLVCDLTLLSLAKRAVELGAFAVVPETTN